MFNDPCSDLEEMESQDPQARRPPGLGQRWRVEYGGPSIDPVSFSFFLEGFV